MTRPYTVREVRKMLLRQAAGLAEYWSNDSNFKSGEKTSKEKIEGALFSFFVLFDGGSIGLPAMDIVLRPHPHDKAFHYEEGDNYFLDGMVINDDCQLHELWSALRNKSKVRNALTGCEEKSVRKYESIVEEVINDIDPYDLFPDAPTDEYALEIREITLRLEMAKTLEHLTEIIYVVFAYNFEVHLKNREVYVEIAQRINQKANLSLPLTEGE